MPKRRRRKTRPPRDAGWVEICLSGCCPPAGRPTNSSDASTGRDARTDGPQRSEDRPPGRTDDGRPELLSADTPWDRIWWAAPPRGDRRDESDACSD